MSDLTDAIEAAVPRLTVALWNAAHGRGHAVDRPRIAVEAPTAHAESHRMGEGSSGAQEAVG